MAERRIYADGPRSCQYSAPATNSPKKRVSTLLEYLQARSVPTAVHTLLNAVVGMNGTHDKFLVSALGNLTPEELAQLEGYLAFCRSRGLDIDYLARCYLTIVEDTLREQMHFMRHGRYRHATYAEVAADVYHNPEYMNRYMYGLAITAFLWPNHVRIARHFSESLPRDRSGEYLEIGPGHGYFLMTAMRLSAFDRFLGVDISATSIAQTRAIAEHFLPDARERLHLAECDFLADQRLEPGRYAAVVMGEVLEHVEQPEAFLRRVAALARADAHIYISTCINAPAIDHIYLWRNTDELEDMMRDNGLRVRDALRLPYDGTTMEVSVKRALAVNVAYVLEKM